MLFMYFVSEFSMDAISYTVARANLAKTMDQVCNDHVVIISLEQEKLP